MHSAGSFFKSRSGGAVKIGRGASRRDRDSSYPRRRSQTMPNVNFGGWLVEHSGYSKIRSRKAGFSQKHPSADQPRHAKASNIVRLKMNQQGVQAALGFCWNPNRVVGF